MASNPHLEPIAQTYEVSSPQDLVQQYHVLYEEHQEMTKQLLDARDEYEKSNSEKESLMKFYQSLKQQLQTKVDE